MLTIQTNGLVGHEQTGAVIRIRPANSSPLQVTTSWSGSQAEDGKDILISLPSTEDAEASGEFLFEVHDLNTNTSESFRHQLSVWPDASVSPTDLGLARTLAKKYGHVIATVLLFPLEEWYTYGTSLQEWSKDQIESVVELFRQHKLSVSIPAILNALRISDFWSADRKVLARWTERQTTVAIGVLKEGKAEHITVRTVMEALAAFTGWSEDQIWKAVNILRAKAEPFTPIEVAALIRKS